jgi:D-beta-D-heptose 7-phosphate kinase/D-beta-D-heptose 1-phosphate adenosyltransferase
MKIIVNGTFDILHPGHLALLNYAKSLGDFLIVAIDTDERVRKLKGSSRPINDQATRKIMLENLRAVDEVQLFNSDDELLRLIEKCDIMVKGSDYIDKPIVGAALIDIEFYERTEHSTTKTIQDIVNRR